MRLRALAAVALVASYYVLALGLTALLVAFAALMVRHEWLNIIDWGGLFAAVFLILKGLAPQRDRFEAPGPRLALGGHPDLARVIESIVRSAGQKVPGEVYLVSHWTIWVARRGGFTGFGNRRVMVLGFPALQVLTVDQLRALLAFQFGLSAHGDTEFSPWIYNTSAALKRTMDVLDKHKSFLRYVFRPYAGLFFRLTGKIYRQQVFRADLTAARFVGKELYLGSLAISHDDSPFSTYWQQSVAPLIGRGYLPPIAEGFGRFMERHPAVPAAPSAVSAALGAEQLATNFPSVPERQAALRGLSLSPRARDSRPAMTLLRNLPEVEASLAEFSLGKKDCEWKTVGWEESAVLAHVPIWRATLAEQEAVCGGMTVADLATVHDRIKDMSWRFRAPRGELPSRERRRQAALDVLSSGLALALYEAGWKVESLPGHPVELSLGAERIEPSGLLTALAAGDLSGSAWHARSESLGIAALSLGAKTILATASAAAR
jgi:hypothetical protein